MSIVEWNSPESRALLDTDGSLERKGETPVNGNDGYSNGHANPVANGHVNAVTNGRTNGHAHPLHRLEAVRRQQGVSQRNVARRLNIDINTVRQQEEETADLPLSTLYQWQRILEVPIAELLVDSNAPLSPPVFERARMVKVMKTVAAIAEKADTPSMKRMLQMLIDQLLEIMPELTDVAPWHTVGQRRTLDEYGRVVERQLPDDMFKRSPR
jgi:transcriptional regulator with XRE-family HTH domain